MALVSALLEIFRRPSLADVLCELVMFIAPLWIVVIVGVLVGWAWKPKWVSLVGRDMSDCSASKQESSSSSMCFASIPSLNSLKFPLPSWSADDKLHKRTLPNSDSSSSQLEQEKSTLVTQDDLKAHAQALRNANVKFVLPSDFAP